MMRSNTIKALALVALLGLAAWAYAGGATHTANLFGGPTQPRAGGVATWHQDTRKVTLTVEVWSIAKAEGGAVYVNGTYVGYMDFVSGAGHAVWVGDLALVRPGSTIAILSADMPPATPLLTGTFR
jgi:hypothetical protein